MSKDPNLVLVVDDDPGMLKALQRLLRAARLRTHPVFIRASIQKSPRRREGGLHHPRYQPAGRIGH